MIRLEKGKNRCPFLPPPEEDIQMQDMRDQILATPRDIEDLAQLGRDVKVCPYYGSRRAIKQAEVSSGASPATLRLKDVQLVVLPYNLLLQKNSREVLGVDIADQVVVIDEAHSTITPNAHATDSFLFRFNRYNTIYTQRIVAACNSEEVSAATSCLSPAIQKGNVFLLSENLKTYYASSCSLHDTPYTFVVSLNSSWL